jgi:hypothetical protein
MRAMTPVEGTADGVIQVERYSTTISGIGASSAKA